MQLLLLCPHFEPDLHAATGEVMSRLVSALVERGNRVDVVTSLPWYKGHDVDPDWRGKPWRVEDRSWGRIIRVWPFPTNKANVPARAVAFGGFTGLLTAAAATLGRPDAVMGMSPPVFLGDAAWLIARRWRVPFVFNVQDIFPDVAVDLGAISNPRVLAVARAHERSLYRRADAVTVLSEDQAANVRSKIDGGADKVHIIHNFVDTDRVRPVDRMTGYRSRHGIGDRTTVMYSGNVGMSQPFELIRQAADAWSHRSDVVFVINGEGAGRTEVDQWAASRDNVIVTDFVPRDQVSDALGTADVHLILLRRGLAKSSTPSKLYGILAAERPAVASIDVGSEVANVLAQADAGWSAPPEDFESFMVALNDAVSSEAERRRRGANGRRWVEEWMSPEHQAEAYERLVDSL